MMHVPVTTMVLMMVMVMRVMRVVRMMLLVQMLRVMVVVRVLVGRYQLARRLVMRAGCCGRLIMLALTVPVAVTVVWLLMRSECASGGHMMVALVGRMNKSRSAWGVCIAEIELVVQDHVVIIIFHHIIELLAELLFKLLV